MSANLRWFVLGLLLAAWVLRAGPTSAQSAQTMFGSFSDVVKAIAVDTNGAVQVVAR